VRRKCRWTCRACSASRNPAARIAPGTNEASAAGAAEIATACAVAVPRVAAEAPTSRNPGTATATQS